MPCTIVIVVFAGTIFQLHGVLLEQFGLHRGGSCVDDLPCVATEFLRISVGTVVVVVAVVLMVGMIIIRLLASAAAAAISIAVVIIVSAALVSDDGDACVGISSLGSDNFRRE